MTTTRTLRRRRTRLLLTGGLLAGPLFVTVVALQMLIRDGFDLSRHPISLLSVGDLGWIQMANFVIGGILAIGFAAAVRRSLRGGRGATWGPWLLAIYGLGMVAGGVFAADPALGFPPGTPDGIPASFSWHGTLHAFAPPVAFLALVASCVVLARRFASDAERRWAIYSVVTAVLAFVLSAPVGAGFSVRLAIAVIVGWAWVSAVASKLLVAQRISYEKASPRTASLAEELL
jgi:hypothetical membrane protein